MARLAATEFGADWVINSDADEFWWPRGASLSHVLGAIPPRYGTVGAFLRTFAPRPDSDEPFAERLTVRFSALAPINDPASLFKPIRKVIHRGHPEITLTRGNHAVVDSPFDPLRGWFPVEVLHFPLRSLGQCRAQGAAAGKRVEAHRPDADRVPRADVRGARERHHGGLLRRAGRLGRGGRARRRGRAASSSTRGCATRCGRSERATPPLAFPTPSLVDEATYAVEAAVLGEADVVRLQRRLDALEHRLATVERGLPNRIYRKLAGPAKRVLRRG